MDDKDEDEIESKNIYTNYKDFLNNLSETEKKISNELTTYRKKIKDGVLTIDIENKIKKSLEHYNNIQKQLSEGYNYNNIPSAFPIQEIDRRQKEIQQFGLNYENMLSEYNKNEKEKYKFKGFITEDYTKKEEFKFMTSEELLTLQKDKIEDQDKQLEEIHKDVKKSTQLAKQTKDVIKDQNKKLEQINEDMERTEEKMNKLTDRFKNYASNISWCKLIVIMLIEFSIAVGAYLFLGS